jgi:hypothetical protein
MHDPLNVKKNVVHLLVWIININMLSVVCILLVIYFFVKMVISKDNSVACNAQNVYVTKAAVYVLHC